MVEPTDVISKPYDAKQHDAMQCDVMWSSVMLYDPLCPPGEFCLWLKICMQLPVSININNKNNS